MKRALLAATILLSFGAEAQRIDPTANLKNYAARVLPQCPGGTLTLESVPGGPAGFDTYGLTLRSTDKYTLTIQIFSLVGGRYSVEWDHVMAATLLASVPVAVIFAALQRYLVRGLALGSVK